MFASAGHAVLIMVVIAGAGSGGVRLWEKKLVESWTIGAK